MPDLKIAGGILSRRLFRIDPSLIVVSVGENSRQDSEQGIEELAQSFLDRDQQEPCGVRRVQDGRIGDQEEKVKLTFGFRRYFAATLINEKNLVGKFHQDGHPFKLLCIVSDAEDEEQAFLSTLTENSERLDLTPIDYARTIQRLEGFGRTRAEIGVILGSTAKPRSQGWISETLSLLELPDWCQGYVASGVLAASTAYDIAKIPEPMLKSVLQWVKREKGKVSRSDIQRAIEGYSFSHFSPQPLRSETSFSPETHSSVSEKEPPAEFGTDPRLPEQIAEFGNKFEALAEYGDITDAVTTDATGQVTETPQKGSADVPAPTSHLKQQSVKPLKLKPRTTRELKQTAQGKAEDESAPANLRKAADLLTQLILRKISDKNYWSKLEGLLKTRPA